MPIPKVLCLPQHCWDWPLTLPSPLPLTPSSPLPPPSTPPLPSPSIPPLPLPSISSPLASSYSCQAQYSSPSTSLIKISIVIVTMMEVCEHHSTLTVSTTLTTFTGSVMSSQCRGRAVVQYFLSSSFLSYTSFNPSFFFASIFFFPKNFKLVHTGSH